MAGDEETQTTEEATTEAAENTEVKKASEKPEGTETTTESTEEKGTLVTEGTKKAPENYDIKAPEGSLLSKSSLDRTEAFAKGRGLSNEEAQELVDVQHQAISEYMDGVKAEMAGWEDQAKKDPEIGGDNFNESVELAKRAVERYGNEAFKKALNETGLGNHPEVVRVFRNIGKAMQEDKLETGSHTEAPKSPEDLFYSGSPANEKD